MSSSSRLAPQKYESVFCIFLVMLAFLYRDNEHLVYPNILYLFIALLTLNLAANFALRHWNDRSWVSALFILANCAVITAILHYSGKEESNLWVLFLLPIYTVCMLLNGKEVLWITLGVISFNWAFLQYSIDRWETEMMFYVLLKSGIFVFAAAATWSIVSRDRRGRERIVRQKEELLLLETKCREQNDQVVQMEKMADIGQLTSGIAHDLNNPITVILGTIKVMLEDDGMDANMRPDLERILRSAELCRVITMNLLGLVKQNEFTYAMHSVNGMIDSVLVMYENTLAQGRIRVEKKFADDLPVIAMSESHMQRVFLNLFSNAKAAMKDGGTITVTTRVFSSRRQGEGSMIEILVEDTGPGIAPEAMPKLFKPFNTTKGPDGTGLGLYLSREIVNRHNGVLQATNRPHGGARFSILLPVEQMQAMAA